MPYNHLRSVKAKKFIGLPILFTITCLAIAGTSRNWFDAGAKATNTERSEVAEDETPI